VNIAEGRTNVDLRAALELENGVEFALLGENLTDTNDIRMSVGNPLGMGTYAVYNRPRTITASLRIPFGE